ncbi:Indoleamine 2,3-dioxygenase subfamily [Ascobolus immersus RN42]|uniref:Indoleamine 2,3-dioxygenase n=1 Tax=Ascobolus immersus RN42 TaxID=1160509 RepID=A0A3N4ICK0_ASCIM|nr:Indoleamine 2,3-dioxygenase subfamily [Ascobolus immersus RN42]
MMPPIPVLSDYGISETLGFLPAELPIQRLTDPYYEPWEVIAQNLQALILAKRIRQLCDALPILGVEKLKRAGRAEEWRRAYVVLGYLTHSYIWGGEIPAQRLPASISIPFQQVSEYLELPPIATYASTCLWNWRPIFPHDPIDDLTNIATTLTFTGSLDESWFYLVSVAIEAKGAAILPIMLHAIAAARKDDIKTVTACLNLFCERIEEVTDLMVRMDENCDPYVFYHRIRPFLAGSKNMEEAGLPNGVLYEDASGHVEYTKFAGGSNAQSSLIQAMDILLDIKHRPTGIKKAADVAEAPTGEAPPRHNFLQEMQSYMPGPHRRFLQDLAKVANIHQFVDKHRNVEMLSSAYDSCLRAVRTFRDKHIEIVTRYIIIPAGKTRRKANITGGTAPGIALKTSPSNGHKAEGGLNSVKASSSSVLKGTGGTALIPFLRQARDETTENAIGNWVGKLVARRREEIVEEEKRVKEREGFVCGLAGMWYSEGGMGGLCSF